MSTTNHIEGRQAELKRRHIGPNTFITADNGGILLEKDTLITVSNLISSKTGKKMTQGDVESLVSFIQNLPPRQFYGKTLEQAQIKVATTFVSRYANMITSNKDVNMLGEYMEEEIMQTTRNEHPYKYTSHADRRGNAVIDRNRADGKKSSPNNIPPAQRIKSFNDPAFVKEILEVLDPIKEFISPQNIDEIILRNKAVIPELQTFQNITLPRRTIPLDSRNKVISNTNSDTITWNLHSAGKPGRLGDVRIQDALCEIIRFRICPFWLPVSDSTNDYYGKIRMNIKELWQSAIVTEFLDSAECIPTTYNYHIEFEINRRDKNRLYLVPVCPIYTFSKPIARVETLTLCFRNPFNVIPVEQDRGTFTITYGNPTLFSLTSAVDHGLTTGDLIYVINASTSNTVIDNNINDVSGWVITRINNLDFTIETDTSLLAPGTLPSIVVLYGSKRIILQIEFTSLQYA